MIKMSHLTAALLFVSASVAQAADQPTQPASQGATSVTNNLATATAQGNTGAVKGLTNAEAHITAQHGKAGKATASDDKAEKGERSEGKAEKAEHLAKADRPVKPERLAKPERAGR